jgi:hypothetical protein
MSYGGQILAALFPNTEHSLFVYGNRASLSLVGRLGLQSKIMKTFAAEAATFGAISLGNSQEGNETRERKCSTLLVIKGKSNASRN